MGGWRAGGSPLRTPLCYSRPAPGAGCRTPHHGVLCLAGRSANNTRRKLLWLTFILPQLLTALPESRDATINFTPLMAHCVRLCHQPPQNHQVRKMSGSYFILVSIDTLYRTMSVGWSVGLSHCEDNLSKHTKYP